MGGGNKRRSGLVLELCQEEDTSRCKEIASVYDRELCENEELFKLVFYLRETAFCLGVSLPVKGMALAHVIWSPP